MVQKFENSSIWRKASIISLVLNVLSSTLISCQGEVIQLALHRNQGERTVRHRRAVDVTADNMHGESGEGYYIKMMIGTPPQQLNVLVDTGSSNFAIAAAPDSQIKKYFLTNESSSYEDSGSSVYVPYTQGDWTGELGTDVVQIASLPNVSVTSNIAFITGSSNFFLNISDWQGIIGFAYQEISRPDGQLVPYFDSLVTEGHIANMFSMHLCGARALPNSHVVNSTDSSMDGAMVLGGVSPSLYTGDIFYTPIVKEWYYEVVMSDIQVNNVSLNMDCKEYNYDKTIVDSGTTNLRLPEKVFQSLVSVVKSQLDQTDMIPSEFFWSGVEVMCWTELSIPYSSFPTLSVSLGISNNTYFTLEMLPQQYLRPVQDPTDPTMSGYCFKFGVASSTSGAVLGAVLMEGFYVIFDRQNKRMGFAETTCEPRDPDLAAADTQLTGPHVHRGVSLLECRYVKAEASSETLLVVAYVMAAVCVLCVMPLLVVAYVMAAVCVLCVMPLLVVAYVMAAVCVLCVMPLLVVAYVMAAVCVLCVMPLLVVTYVMAAVCVLCVMPLLVVAYVMAAVCVLCVMPLLVVAYVMAAVCVLCVMPLLVVTYVMAAVCVLCVMPLLVMVVQYQVRKCRDRHKPLDSSSDTGNLINR